MNLFDKQVSHYLPGVALGVGAALITPVLVVAALSLMRPLAKAAIKGGFILKDAALGAYSLAESQVGRLSGSPEVKQIAVVPKTKAKSTKPEVKELTPKTMEPSQD